MHPVNRPPPLALSAHPPRRLLPLALLAALASVAWPLATYSLTLAWFGPAHVAAEMSYLRRRFSGFLGRLLLPIAVLLLVIASMRASALFGYLPRSLSQQIELLAGLGLVVVTLPRWMRASLPSAASGIAATSFLVAGLLWYPTEVLLIVAVTHNWTPIPLIGEALTQADRSALRGYAFVLFVGLPALIATGLPRALLDIAGIASDGVLLLDPGSLSDNYGAYLPRSVRGTDAARALFSAVVCAQCLHYIATIGLMPRMSPEPAPRGPRLALVAVTAALFALYLLDFSFGRSIYGIAASMHAWIELPILLLALLPRETAGS